MNERGGGINDVFIFLAVICLAVLVTMVMYNKTIKDLFSGDDTTKMTYNEIEESLINSAKNYTDNYYYKPLENGDNDYVTVRTLETEGIIQTIIDPEDDKITCTGYVNFSKEDDQTTYEPYLRCGSNYETTGYEEKYDAR